MCSTRPMMPSHSITSPMRIFSRIMIRTPARKFSKMSWNAKPIATAPIPSPAMALAGVKPGRTMAAAISSPTSHTASLATVWRSCFRLSRMWAWLTVRSTRRDRNPAANSVITRTATAMTRLGKAATKPAAMLLS